MDQVGSSVPFDASINDEPLTDDELTELALAADFDAPLSIDAVPFALQPNGLSQLLPSWYMPGTVRRSTTRWWRTVALVLVLSFLVIEAAGLCSTYGSLVVP